MLFPIVNLASPPQWSLVLSDCMNASGITGLYWADNHLLGQRPAVGICFGYDGASLHRACWMAMVVYTLTIHLLGNQFHHLAWERHLVSTTLCSLLSDMFSLPSSASYIKYFALVTCTMFSKNVLVRGTINQSWNSINFEPCLLSYLASHNPSFQNVNNIRLVSSKIIFSFFQSGCRNRISYGEITNKPIVLGLRILLVVLLVGK